MPTWSFPTFEHLQAAWWLLALPLLVLVWWYARKQRRQVLESWGQSTYSLPIRRRRGRWLLTLIVIALVLALMGPEMGTTSITPASSARDLFLIIDVSQSMLAEDQPPRSRLSRAQQAALELVADLNRQKAGTRIGLIIFAGQARLLCPPTLDLDHVAHLIQELSTESLGETGRVVDEQGVTVGTSFTALLQLLHQWGKANATANEFTDGIILSDGDELVTNATPPVAAPFRLSAYAIGDSAHDWPIPLGNSYVMTNNGPSERALTRRHEERLQKLIAPTSGMLLIEDASQLPLARWWHAERASLPDRSLQSQARTVPINRAGWLLGFACLVLLLELAWGGARQRLW